MNNNCLNCGVLLDGNFCKNCGQKASAEKITFKSVIESYITSIFSIEGALLKTITVFIKNPGFLFREYLAGKRKAYNNPVSFFFTITGLYIILRALLNYDPLQGLITETSNKNYPAYFKIVNSAGRFMFTNINYIVIFLVFSTALMLKTFFRKRYNLAEYTMVGFYIAGFFLILGIITMIISELFLIHLRNIQLILLGVLLIYSLISFLQVKSFGEIIKSILVSVTSLMLYILLGFGFSLLVVIFIWK